MEDTEPVEKDDDLIPIGEFIDAVKAGGFIDYDGMGHFSDGIVKEKGADKWVYPSQIMNNVRSIPMWVSHVAWYNR